MISGVQKASVMIPGPLYPDLFAGRETPIIVPGEAVCLGCGCSDFDACEGGCWWDTVDYDVGVGVCSNCLDWHGVLLCLEEISCRRRNESTCHRCGCEKDPLIVRRHGRIIVALRVCIVCYA